MGGGVDTYTHTNLLERIILHTLSSSTEVSLSHRTMSIQRKYSPSIINKISTDVKPNIAKIGQLVPLKAKSDQGEALRQFLITGYGLLSGNQEPETLQWFALKYNTPEPNYAIFDTYAAESGRQAHITGEVAKALFANADTLLSVVPDLPATNYNLLASKIKPTLAGVEGDPKKGLTVGLRVLVKAKQDQIAAVREFLQVCAINPQWSMDNLLGVKRARFPS